MVGKAMGRNSPRQKACKRRLPTIALAAAAATAALHCAFVAASTPHHPAAARPVNALTARAAVQVDDPLVAAKLKEAQERVLVAKRGLGALREELEGRNFFSPPIDKWLVAEVLLLFADRNSAALRPLLDKELATLLPKISNDAEALSTLATAMAQARLPHEPAWLSLADVVTAGCTLASGTQLGELAWSFATAGERKPELWAALKKAMAGHVRGLTEDQRVTFGWACAEVGHHATDLLGSPKVAASAEAARTTLNSLRRRQDVERLLESPVPIALVPDAVTPEQAKALIQLADSDDLWRSSSRRAARDAEGDDAVRTSYSALLSALKYRRDPVVLAIQQWAAAFFGLPIANVESLQLVRYTQGQEYSAHVDWGREQDASLWLGGQRVATALIYLNTLPEGCGGETAFTRLGLQVTPRAGSALVWPNVDQNGVPEILTEHRAMPVLCTETKYAVNVWVREKALPQYGDSPSEA